MIDNLVPARSRLWPLRLHLDRFCFYTFALFLVSCFSDILWKRCFTFIPPSHPVRLGAVHMTSDVT